MPARWCRILRVRVPRLIARVLWWRCVVCEGRGYLISRGIGVRVRGSCDWCRGTGFNIESPRGWFRRRNQEAIG